MSSFKEMGGGSKSVTYIRLTLNNFNQVSEFVASEFYPRNPITVFQKATRKDAEIFAKMYVTKILAQNLSIGAYDTKSGHLIGINLIISGKYPEISNEDEEITPSLEEFARMEEFLIGTSLEDLLGTNNYVNPYILCTKSDYNGQGIGTELMKKMHVMAIEEGYKKACVVATNYFTQKIAKKLGYNTIKSISYEEYIDPISGKNIFSKVPEPHKVYAMAVKDLGME